MALPPRQQHILDGIGETLKASEPRLAGMFVIFTRLAKNEAPPMREQLSSRPAPLAWLSGLAWRARRNWRRALAVSQVTVAFALLAVLTGSISHASGCASARGSGAAATATVPRPACRSPLSQSQPGEAGK